MRRRQHLLAKNAKEEVEIKEINPLQCEHCDRILKTKTAHINHTRACKKKGGG